RDASVYVDVATCLEPMLSFVVAGVEHEGGTSFGFQTCEHETTFGVPCCDCIASVREIVPQGSFDVHWDGLLFDATKMPLECYSNKISGLSGSRVACAQPTAAPDGAMTVRARVFGKVDPGPFLQSDRLPAEQAFVHGRDSAVTITVH